MNKVKTLSILSISLLVINLILIWFLVTNKMPHNRKEGPKKIIIEQLDFNESQIKEYEKLIDLHRTSIRQSELEMMAMKNELYTTLQKQEQTDIADSLIAAIGNKQIQIEHIHYKHFQDIKQLCQPEQLKLFDELCKDIAKLFAHKPLPPHEK
jgi:protein CpxP